jgi:hypothetical protein
MVAVSIKCVADVSPKCEVRKNINVYADDYDAFLHGKLAQDAFPYLTPADRELLITNTCGPCFSQIMSEPEW